jgi:hypothetical protein
MTLSPNVPQVINDVPPLKEGNASYHPSFIPAPEQRAGGEINNNKTGYMTPAFQEPVHQPESYRGPLCQVGDNVMRQLNEQLKGLPDESQNNENKSTTNANSTEGDEAKEEASEENSQSQQNDGTEPKNEASLQELTNSASQPQAAENEQVQRTNPNRSARTKKSIAQDQQPNDSTATGDPPDDSQPADKRGQNQKKCAG